MIKAILVFNNHGKPRLLKFYHYYVSFALVFGYWSFCSLKLDLQFILVDILV